MIGTTQNFCFSKIFFKNEGKAFIYYNFIPQLHLDNYTNANILGRMHRTPSKMFSLFSQKNTQPKAKEEGGEKNRMEEVLNAYFLNAY